MKLLRTFSKRYCFRKVALYLVVCCLVVCCLFFSIWPSAILAGPKGKALGLSELHGNPHSSSVLTPINAKVNPAGIIVGTGGIKTNGVTNPSEYIMNGYGVGANGYISSPRGKILNVTANSYVNPAGIIVGAGGAKTNQTGSTGCLVAAGPGKKVLLAQPGSNVFVEIDSLVGNKGIKVKNNGISGQVFVLAAGDAFSEAIAGSLTTEDSSGKARGHHWQGADFNPGGGPDKLGEERWSISMLSFSMLPF